jgi:hypothetical protein
MLRNRATTTSVAMAGFRTVLRASRRDPTVMVSAGPPPVLRGTGRARMRNRPRDPRTMRDANQNATA